MKKKYEVTIFTGVMSIPVEAESPEAAMAFVKEHVIPKLPVEWLAPDEEYKLTVKEMPDEEAQAQTDTQKES